jgi:APA family basic amino acid/polyamine antiporter
MSGSEAAAASSTERPELRKSVGRLGFFALAFGSMIGVGWVTALGDWLGDAGPIGASLAFVFGSALILAIGLCYAEVCSMLPVAGGEVAYAYRAFGTSKAYGVGSFLAFGYLAVSVFEAISVAKVFGYLIPGIDHWPLFEINESTVYGSQILLSAVTTGLITWINYRGVESAARVQVALVVLFGLATLAFLFAGFLGGDLANLEPGFGADVALEDGVTTVAPFGLGAAFAGLGMVFVTAPFWFVGFDTIPQAAEEAHEAVTPRALARLIVVSIVGAACFYILVILAVGMSAPWTELVAHLVEGDLVAAKAFEEAFGSPLLADLVLIAALLGLFTSWNGFFLAGSRVLFALGRGRLAPPGFGRTHARFGTPSVAVGFAGVFTFVGACLGPGALGVFINVGSFCMSLAFFGVTFSTMRLRRSAHDLERPFRAPGGRALPTFASLGAALIVLAMVLPFSPASLSSLEWIVLGAVVALISAGWLLAGGVRRGTPEAERAHLILGRYAPPEPSGDGS